MKVTTRLAGFFLLCTVQLAIAQSKDTPKPGPQRMFAPYWTAEPGWHSEFQLRNNLTNGALTVTPVLRLYTGQEVALTPVTIQPSDVVTVDVAQELQKTPALVEQARAYGSVVFKYNAAHFRNLYAAAMVHAIGQPIGYHIDAFGTDDEDNAATREGIWWLPRPSVKDNLIISNASDKPNRARLFLYDAAGKSWHRDIPLGPRQTVRLVAGDLVKTAGLSGTYGGITFQIAERSGSVDTVHFVYDETNGFSALMKMFDHDPSVTLEERAFLGNSAWTTWAPMFALQNPDPALALPKDTQLQPQVLIRNTTAKPQTANIKLTWRSDATKDVVPLTPIRLRSFETRLIDVAALQQKGQIPLDAHWALVEISGPAAKPDDIMAVASSYDSTGRYGAQTPFNDQLDDHWVAGEFQVDATHNSLMAVTNVGKKSAETQITFHYNQGQSHYELLKIIAPGDQLWLNLGDLIRGAVPDSKGATFPTDLTYGTYDIRQLKAVSGPSIFEGKIIVDKTYGHLAYGCVGCCGYISVQFFPTPYSNVVGAGTPDSILAQNSCNSPPPDDVTDLAYNWLSSDPSVASVTTAYTSLVGAGTATGRAQVQLAWGNRLRTCPNSVKTATQSITSQPTISGPNGVWWFNGESETSYPTSATLTANAGGASVTWSVPAGSNEITLTPSGNQPVVVSNGQNFSSSVGDVRVTATANGVTSPQFALTTRRPKDLAAPSSYTQCDSNWGYDTNITYVVRDQLTATMTLGFDYNEQWTTGPNRAYPSTNWPQNPETPGLSPGTYLSDQVAGPGVHNVPEDIPMPTCPPATPTEVINWGQAWRIGSQQTAHGVLVQTDTIHKYNEHGAHSIP